MLLFRFSHTPLGRVAEEVPLVPYHNSVAAFCTHARTWLLEL